jgi:NAD(P)-dependent dehydrogenase (short-subunit alcohol dehydrogenase family)
MHIANKTILVTGGSSGLGAACCSHFAQRGANIINLDILPPRKPESGAHAERIRFVQTDVTKEADVRAAIDQATNDFGGVSAAILCAGILHAERVLGRDGVASLEAFRRVIEVNLVGAFNVARLAAEAIAKQAPEEDGERGAIVMTASVAAFDGQIGQASYSASKGGIASMILPLAREFAKFGIRVVSIAPGVFETPMMENAPEKVRQSLIDQTPFPNRLGKPVEFAMMVEHIFQNAMLNGCTVRLDGAMRMAAK